MSQYLTSSELLELGFHKVGENAQVSTDARFFSINGSLGNNVRIDAFAVLTGNIELGNDVHISPFCFLGGTGGKITMADRSGLSTHVSIFTKSEDYRNQDLQYSKKVSGDVHIGNHSIIGAGAKIMPNVKIGSQVSAGCHCIIVDDVDQGSVIISRGTGVASIASRS